MNITTQPPVLSSVCLVESRHDWHWDTLVGGLFMRKRETNLTLEFTREVVAGAQMLIAAKYSQLRSGKSVRESKAALKRCFFLWAGRREHTWNMKYCYSWAESSPLSFTTLRLPNAFFFVWASNKTCAEHASFLLLVFPERPTVSQPTGWWQWQQQPGGLGLTVPFWCPFAVLGSSCYCSCSISTWCVLCLCMEQGWQWNRLDQHRNTDQHWIWGKGNSKAHICLCCGYSVTKKIEKAGCLGWIRLYSSDGRVQETDTWNGKGYHREDWRKDIK